MPNHPPGGEIENPGALAGATGANIKADNFKSEEYRKRAEKATALCHAIADCHPQDACMIMEAALADLRFGAPVAHFDGLMAEARVWAEFATPHELKAYCAATFEAMRAKDQSGFLAYAQGRATA